MTAANQIKEQKQLGMCEKEALNAILEEFRGNPEAVDGMKNIRIYLLIELDVNLALLSTAANQRREFMEIIHCDRLLGFFMDSRR